MRPVKDDIIKGYLMSEKKVPDYKAEICVAFARGNLGKAAMLAENEDFDALRESVINLLKHIKDMESWKISSAIKELSDKKTQISDYLDIMLVWYRDVLLYKACKNANNLIFTEELQYIKKVSDTMSFEDIENVINDLEIARKRIDSNVNFDLTMELLLLNIQEKNR
jgi:DNA polymerase-3 subunit delta'